jgi:hypothetical protein
VKAIGDVCAQATDDDWETIADDSTTAIVDALAKVIADD